MTIKLYIRHKAQTIFDIQKPQQACEHNDKHERDRERGLENVGKVPKQ